MRRSGILTHESTFIISTGDRGDLEPTSPIGLGERLAGLLPSAVPQGDHGFVSDRPEAILDNILGDVT
jgi:hypothetical protein